MSRGTCRVVLRSAKLRGDKPRRPLPGSAWEWGVPISAREREQPSGESPPAAPITPSYLDALRQANAQRQQQREQSGLDFHSAKTRIEWSVSSFTRLVAKLLGRQLSALGPRELETLKAFQQQHPRMHEALVRQAAADVDSPTITHVLLRTQTERDVVSLLSQALGLATSHQTIQWHSTLPKSS